MFGKSSKQKTLKSTEIETLLQPESTPEAAIDETLHSHDASQYNVKWQSFSAPTIAAIDLISDKLREVSGLLEQSTQNVSQKFVRLAENSHLLSNTEGITDKVSSVSVGEKDITINELTSILQSTIDKTLGRIEQISNQSKATLHALDEAINSIHEVEKLKVRINSINKQANLLSLNANIESARAGESAQGFAAVATEISHVSKEIGKLSTEMTSGLNHVSESVKKGFTSLKNFNSLNQPSSKDIDRKEIDSLLQALIGQKDELNRIFKTEAQTSQNITADISGAIITQMQMQGFIKQNLNNSADALDEIKNILISYDKQDIQRVTAYNSKLEYAEKIKQNLQHTDLKSSYDIKLENYVTSTKSTDQEG